MKLSSVSLTPESGLYDLTHLLTPTDQSEETFCRSSSYMFCNRQLLLTHPDPAVGPRVLLFLQSLPTLVKFSNKSFFKIHDLKSRHVGSSVLNLRQIAVQKSLNTHKHTQ